MNRAQELGRKAQRIYFEKFSADKYIRKLENLYLTMMNRKR